MTDGEPKGVGAQAAALAAELDLDPDDRALVAGLLRLGVPARDLREAASRGRLEDAIFDQILDPQREARTVSLGELARSGGLDLDELRELLRAFGLPAPPGDEPYFTPEEAEVFREIARLGELWPPEVRLRVSRVYGQALGRIAQTEVHHFRSRVEPLLREVTGNPLDALAAVRDAFGWLLPLADPMLLGVHRRKIEQELTQAAVWEVEVEAAGVVPGSREVTLLFCDVKGFTAYADAHGDAAALAALDRFAESVEENRGESGRLVKALGDGYLLAYPEPTQAVAAAVAIAAPVRSRGGIALHAGVHHGIAVFRDGDYFGRAVNLAARLLSAAGADQLVATEHVARTAPGFDWRALGASTLRGFTEPLSLFGLDLAAPRPVAPARPPCSS